MHTGENLEWKYKEKPLPVSIRLCPSVYFRSFTAGLFGGHCRPDPIVHVVNPLVVCSHVGIINEKISVHTPSGILIHLSCLNEIRLAVDIALANMDSVVVRASPCSWVNDPSLAFTIIWELAFLFEPVIVKNSNTCTDSEPARQNATRFFMGGKNCNLCDSLPWPKTLEKGW